MAIYKNASGGVSTTTGTGPLVISGAIDGYAAITADFTNGQQANFYAVSGASYMVFLGTYNTSGTSITVNTVLRSSNSNNPVNWSGTTIFIYVVAPASAIEKLEYMTVTEAVDLDRVSRRDRFWYKPAADTPIFVLVTGQSNADGRETAVTQFPVDTGVKVYQWGADSTPNDDPTHASYSFVTPNPATNYNSSLRLPMVGYYGNSKGNVGLSMATELRKLYPQRNVIVLTICASGAEIEYWIEKPVGALTMNERLISFKDHVITLPELTDVTYPDIMIWGQSESNAGTKSTPTDYTLTPEAYNTKWQAVYDDLVANDVISTEYTNIYLMDMVKPVNDTYKWEGTKHVARNTNNKVTFVSGTGLPWQEPDDVHFTGDSANLYGRMIAQIDGGMAPGKNTLSTSIVLDKQPELGANLDAAGFDIESAGDIDAGSILITTPTATITALPSTFPGAFTGTITINYASGAVGDRVSQTETFIFQQSASILALGTAYANATTVKNLSSVAANLSSYTSFYAKPTFTADSQSISLLTNLNFNSTPIYSITGGGVLAVSNDTAFSAGATVGTGVTLTNQYGVIANAATGSGTVTSQAAFIATLGTKATNRTNFLGGTVTIPAGTFNMYQSDTNPNRFNGGMIAPIRVQSGSTAAVSVKGDRNLVFLNGSTSTITFPTLTSMTTGHTAAQMTGYELVLINNRTTAVVSGTDFLLGASTSWGFGGTFSLGAKESRTFVWDGTSIWY